MIRRIARRLAWSLFVIWATVTLAFLVNFALPSNPARIVAGPQAPPARVAAVRKELGLDRPLTVQYAYFLKRLAHVGPNTADGPHATCLAVGGGLHVDLGKSYQQRRPVVTILAERLPRTLMLAAAAIFVQMTLGILAGVIAAVYKRTAIDFLAVSTSLIGISTPTFVTGLLLQWFFGHYLHLLPLDGYGESPGEHLASLILPALTLGIFGAAYYTRLVRDEMIGQLSQGYVQTALAKGLPRRTMIVRHALRNAWVPIVTLVGLEAGTLVGGAVVTESIFRWPGLGSLSVTAMLDRDGPIVMGSVIVTAIAVTLSTVAADVMTGLLDPRSRARD